MDHPGFHLSACDRAAHVADVSVHHRPEVEEDDLPPGQSPAGGLAVRKRGPRAEEDDRVEGEPLGPAPSRDIYMAQLEVAMAVLAAEGAFAPWD